MTNDMQAVQIVRETLAVLIGNEPFHAHVVENLPCFTPKQRKIAAACVALFALPCEDGRVVFVA